jgi:hypothetical protein
MHVLERFDQLGGPFIPSFIHSFFPCVWMVAILRFVIVIVFVCCFVWFVLWLWLTASGVLSVESSRRDRRAYSACLAWHWYVSMLLARSDLGSFLDFLIAEKIAQTGFAALSSLDSGYYGKGIYFVCSVHSASSLCLFVDLQFDVHAALLGCQTKSCCHYFLHQSCMICSDSVLILISLPCIVSCWQLG